MGDNLFLVTARSGSKGVAHKNIREFGGIPALGLRILSIQRSGVPGYILCSTDSPQYADIARSYGADVPFIRPPELCGDNASSVEVILHALTWLREAEREFSTLILIEPSSPFCRPVDIQTGVALLREQNTDSTVAVRKVEPHPIFSARLGVDQDFSGLAVNLETLRDLRRQSLELTPYFTPTGSFYAAKIPSFLRSKTFYTRSTKAFVVDEPYGIEIDCELDFFVARTAWEEGLVDRKLWLS